MGITIFAASLFGLFLLTVFCRRVGRLRGWWSDSEAMQRKRRAIMQVILQEDDADALSAENDDVFGWVLVLINSICLASIPFYLLTVVRAARRLADDEMVARCEAAITQTQQLRFPCHFLRFSVLKARGKDKIRVDSPSHSHLENPIDIAGVKKIVFTY